MPPFRRVLSMAIAVALSVLAEPASAQDRSQQEVRPLALEDYFEVVSVGSVGISPNGERVVYTVSHPREASNDDRVESWVVQAVGGGEPERILHDGEDVISGVDYLVEHFPVDPERVGSTGHSYGGILTNWLITRYPDRIRAAVSGAGESNWTSNYALSDVARTKDTEFFGPPWEPRSREIMIRQSPYLNCGGARTPTLFVHGAEDYRVPLTGSTQLYTCLKRQGVPSRLIVYEGMAHGIRGHWNNVHRMMHELRWWEEHLKPSDVRASLPAAEPNDQRSTAGRMVDGELVVELEAMAAVWRPRGEDGPALVVHAWAEKGGPPQVPGPLIRAEAGTPIRVSIANRLDGDLQVRGLLDRATMVAERPSGVPPEAPDFLFAGHVDVPAGDTVEVRFTPTSEVTSFYTGRSAPPYWAPFGTSGDVPESALLGGLVLDDPDRPPPPDERIFIISQLPVDGGGLGFKAFLNGLAWPFTERPRYALGDTVSWRVVNLTLNEHPMHLHGFYYQVDGTGDGDTDRVLLPEERRMVVTEEVAPLGAMRMTWVPDEPGNWLFHCHIIRHMGPLQRFAEEGEPPDPEHDHAMHHMAGLVLGVTVDPPPGWTARDPEPIRRIDLWTGSRPNVFAAHPELGFVVQEGDRPPPPDSVRVPGSPLLLTRGEATEIVIHNRLAVALSVHWHGLELPSLYDGVGHWSGMPGSVRPPILPGESASVIIAPRRAGTFMYHIHGETGHELTQGLYGPFLVLEPGEVWDPEADRLFLMAARGAELDSPPVVNGFEEAPAERFWVGRTYRLRFLHISPDETKDVRLEREGASVRWRAFAKDGADLPSHQQVEGEAEVSLAVGETWDFLWTPTEAGEHELVIRTNFYPGMNLPPAYQRVRFLVEGGRESPES